MKFVYFIKTRTIYIVLFVMSIICAGALIIAGKMTVIAYKKQGQEIGSQKILNVTADSHTKVKFPALKTISEYPLYFNGRRVEGLKAFKTAKGELLLPIDDICNYLGVKYIYHPTDEIFESEINHTKLALNVGNDSCTVNDKELKLPYAVILSNDRILVPMEVLNSINGFSVSAKADVSAAYMNYTRDYKNSVHNRIFYEAASNTAEGIYNFFGKQQFEIDKGESTSSLLYSVARRGALYVTNNRAYFLSKVFNFKPYKLDMGAGSQWSEDMKTIYEPLNDFNNLRIYNLDNGKISTLENVRNIIAGVNDFEDFSAGVLRLVSYWNYDKIVRITVLNTKNNKVCTVLYKENNPILIAKAWLSPTGRYMVYSKDGEYRLCAFDGEQDVSLGNPLAVKWVSDSSIMLLKASSWQLYGTDGKIKTQEEVPEYKTLGVIGDWTVLYSDGKAIYRSENGIDTKVVDIEAKLDDVVADNELKAIIASDSENNSVYLITGGTSRKISDMNSLLKSVSESGITTDLKRSVKISPDRKTFCIAKVEKDGVLIYIMAVDGTWSKEVRLDSDAYYLTQYGTAELEYINNSRILYKDISAIWSIDLQGENPEILRTIIDEKKLNGVMIN